MLGFAFFRCCALLVACASFAIILVISCSEPTCAQAQRQLPQEPVTRQKPLNSQKAPSISFQEWTLTLQKQELQPLSDPQSVRDFAYSISHMSKAALDSMINILATCSAIEAKQESNEACLVQLSQFEIRHQTPSQSSVMTAIKSASYQMVKSRFDIGSTQVAADTLVTFRRMITPAIRNWPTPTGLIDPSQHGASRDSGETRDRFDERFISQNRLSSDEVND